MLQGKFLNQLEIYINQAFAFLLLYYVPFIMAYIYCVPLWASTYPTKLNCYNSAKKKEKKNIYIYRIISIPVSLMLSTQLAEIKTILHGLFH